MKIFKLRLLGLLASAIIFSFFNISIAQASVVSYKTELNVITFKLDKGVMKITVCREDIIGVKYSIFDSIPEKASLVVVNDWKSYPEFNVLENKDEVIITTGRLKIKVSKSNNAVIYTDLQDAIILSENGTNGKTMNPSIIAGIQTYNCSTEIISPWYRGNENRGC